MEDFENGIIENLKLIGIFKERVETSLNDYGSSNIIFYAKPVMLLRDYENQKIKGQTYKQSSIRFFRDIDDINGLVPLYASWQRYDENHEIVEVHRYISSADYETLSSLKKGNVFSFEADLNFLYYIERGGCGISKSPLLFNIRNIERNKEQGANQKMKQLIKQSYKL